MSLAAAFVESYSGSIDFTICRHEKNRGLSAARNTGTDAAKGDWIFYLDSDDYLDAKAIELLMSEIDLHPDIEIVIGKIQSVPYRKFYDRKKLEQYHYIDYNATIRDIYFDLPINATNKLVAKSFIERNGLRFKEGTIHEDELWSYYLYSAATKVAFVHECTYFHKINPNSIMTTLTKEKDSKNWMMILDEVSKSITDPLASKLETYYLSKLIYHYEDTPEWQIVYHRFYRLLLDSNHTLDSLALKRFRTTMDRYYSQFFTYSGHKGCFSKMYLLLRHDISRLFKRSC